MANERLTEDMIRSHFKSDTLFNVIKLEEQKSTNRKVNDLLQNASKAKTAKGVGRPEFLLSFPVQNSDYLIVVECKASVTKHQSKSLDKPKDYAVDGVLHYAKILSEDFEVIAIAASGENETELKISTYKWLKGGDSFLDQKSDKLLPLNDYLKLFNNETFSENLKNIDIIQKAVYLNDEFHSYSITENGRCTIVSAILISLLDVPFKNSYSSYKKSSELANALIEAIKRVLGDDAEKIRNANSMLNEFQKILNEPIFKQERIKRKKDEKLTIEVIKDFIDYIYKNVYPLITMEDAGIDVLGKFYTEFIRYAGSSQKQGLVLTPAHVTDLFCDLAGITPDSYVYDPCCGSGGFLIAAMKRMLELAGHDLKKKANIKSEQLIGVERRADMFTYACSNMMFRGDGKSNIYNGDCFNLESEIVSNHSADVVFLNPPYDIGNVGQMEFIEHGLRVISPRNGIVIAIVQMSCAIKNDKELIAVKERLLKKNRLKAVISMPDELFNPGAAVPTCIMVWENNSPNKDYETWFGYLKDDGFEKRKNKGRIDVKKRWGEIRDNFIHAYKNSKEIPGLSVKKNIRPSDEWVAEAYMQTDYSTLSDQDFITELKKYAAFKILN